MSEVTPLLTTIADLKQHIGQPVTLRGWLYNLRSSGKLLFPTFRDGTGTVQGIVPKAAVPEHVFDTLKNLTLESSLTVTGTVREDQRAPSGVELDVQDVTITQRIPEETPYPISRKSTASTSSWSTATSGSAPRASPPSCGFAQPSCVPRLNTLISMDSSAPIRPSSRPTPAKAPPTSSR